MKQEPLVRVAVISPYAGTIASFRGPLIRELIERGARVWVLAPDYSPQTRVDVQNLGAIPVDYFLERTGMNPLRDIYGFFDLWKKLHKLQPDLVFSYMTKPVIYGTLAARLAGVGRRYALIEGVGYAFSQLNQFSLRGRALTRIVAVLYKFALRQAMKAYFLNPDDLSEFVDMGLVSGDRSACLGGIGVILDEWPPAPPVLEPVTFTLAARLIREKGICEFVEAARRVKRKFSNTRFLLLGGVDTNPGGIDVTELRRWVEEGLIEWPGHVSDMPRYLAQTSVYVLPSYREGVPRSTQEAMAMARPVITTDVPGCRETVVDGVNGFLIPPKDPVALAEAMEQFVTTPQIIAQMGIESRRLAEEKFDALRINRRLAGELLDGIILHQ